MSGIMIGFGGRVTNVFVPKGCVAFEMLQGAMVVEGSQVLFEKGEHFLHRQAAGSVQINHRPVQVVATGEKCAILIEGTFDELPPNNSDVFLVEGASASVGGRGTIFKVYPGKGVACVKLEEGALCKGDWIVIHGDDGYRHEQIASSIEVGCHPKEAVLAGKKLGILIEVNPEIGLPAEGDTVTVISIKK